MKAIKQTLLIGLFVLTNTLAGFSQIIGNNAVTQTPTNEVRKGSAVDYSVATGHVAGDLYSWEIVGGMPTPAPSSGSGTVADPYIINFTANLTDVSILWAADDNTTTSLTGRVRVQKRNAGGCVSVIQDLQVDRWSAATVATSGTATATICNGENVGLTIPLTVTGAPGFTIDYRVDNNLTGTLQTSNESTTGTSIAVPDRLINTTAVDQTYTITVTRMNDAFTGDGIVSVTAKTYTLTVHPGSSMSPITVSPASLIRR